jgi:hypothetical protein
MGTKTAQLIVMKRSEMTKCAFFILYHLLSGSKPQCPPTTTSLCTNLCLSQLGLNKVKYSARSHTGHVLGSAAAAHTMNREQIKHQDNSLWYNYSKKIPSSITPQPSCQTAVICHVLRKVTFAKTFQSLLTFSKTSLNPG